MPTPNSPVSHSSPTLTEECIIGSDVEPLGIPLEDYYEFLNCGFGKKGQLKEQWPDIRDVETFLSCAMEMSRYFGSSRRDGNVLRFKLTRRKMQPTHPTRTQSRPALVAAFEKDWSINEEHQVKSWGLIHLVGEVATSEKTREDHLKRATQSLQHLILARPDLYLAHGLLLEETGVTFLAGITGKGAYSTILQYTDTALLPLLYALIQHLYDPGSFKDEHYEVKYNAAAQRCLYTLSITTPGQQLTKFGGLELKYAGVPFGTCTYVFVVHGKLGEPIKMQNGTLRVIKDQYCGESAFNEPDILKHIHADGVVPGVIKLIHDESWILPTKRSARIKRRLGFEQVGTPFMNAKTVKDMLEAAFDILEVTRHLRVKRNVLHRDISSGNILLEPTAFVNAIPVIRDTQELDLCFIKHLLGENSDPRQTNAFLIDFNRSERLDPGEDVPGDVRTGTPIFMARAVQHGKPYPTIDPRGIEQMVFPPIPVAHPSYGRIHPQRIKLFDNAVSQSLLLLNAFNVSKGSSRTWRHELYHEAESVYWLATLWLMCAKPMQPIPEQVIDNATWTLIQGTENDRHLAIISLINLERIPSSFIHSTFKPVETLLAELSGIISPCPHFLDDTDIRAHPEYVHEAMQRAFFNFLVENRDETFMTIPVASESRQTPEGCAYVFIKPPQFQESSSTQLPPLVAKRSSPASFDTDTPHPKRNCYVEEK